MLKKLDDQQLTDLAARVLLLEAAVVSIANGLQVRELLAAMPDAELEREMRTLGASDNAFKLRDLLKAQPPDA
jgi:hypothetical protein